LRRGSVDGECIEEHKTTMEITVEENDELRRL
jgi:hypothetical protein